MAQAIPYPGFIGSSNRSLSPVASNERTVNFYIEKIQGTVNPKGEFALYPTPGLGYMGAVSGHTRGRAAFEENGRVFCVIGERLFEATYLPLDGLVFIERLGTLLEGAAGTPAEITSNGDGGGELAIASGNKLYVYNLATNVLTEVLADGARHVDSLDGFIVVLDTRDSTLRASNLYDALTFDPLAIEQRASAPDPWLSLIVQNGLIYVMGEQTTDVYYNAGLSPFPFQKHTGGSIPYGIAAEYSKARVGDSVIWLARNEDGIGQVVQVVGQQAKIISNFALSAAIQGYLDAGITIADAIGESWEMLGHLFYVLTFPTANATWLYDDTMGRWTELLSWDISSNTYRAWRAHWHVIGFGKHLVLDRENGQIYHLSTTVHTENAQPIRRLRRAPCLFDGHKRVFINSLELILESGLGLSNPVLQGYDPTMLLYRSKDSGRTFTQCGEAKSAGKLGEYRTRVQWQRLGAGRDLVFEFVVSDPIPWRIIDALIEPRPGAGT